MSFTKVQLNIKPQPNAVVAEHEGKAHPILVQNAGENAAPVMADVTIVVNPNNPNKTYKIQIVLNQDIDLAKTKSLDSDLKEIHPNNQRDNTPLEPIQKKKSKGIQTAFYLFSSVLFTTACMLAFFLAPFAIFVPIVFMLVGIFIFAISMVHDRFFQEPPPQREPSQINQSNPFKKKYEIEFDNIEKIKEKIDLWFVQDQVKRQMKESLSKQEAEHFKKEIEDIEDEKIKIDDLDGVVGLSIYERHLTDLQVQSEKGQLEPKERLRISLYLYAGLVDIYYAAFVVRANQLPEDKKTAILEKVNMFAGRMEFIYSHFLSGTLAVLDDQAFEETAKEIRVMRVMIIESMMHFQEDKKENLSLENKKRILLYQFDCQKKQNKGQIDLAGTNQMNFYQQEITRLENNMSRLEELLTPTTPHEEKYLSLDEEKSDSSNSKEKLLYVLNEAILYGETWMGRKEAKHNEMLASWKLKRKNLIDKMTDEEVFPLVTTYYSLRRPDTELRADDKPQDENYQPQYARKFKYKSENN